MKTIGVLTSGGDAPGMNAAVELLKNGIGNRVIALKNCEIVNYDIFEALNMPKTFDEETYLLANMISN